MSFVCASAWAQREVTPVETDDKKPASPVLHYYDRHGDPLQEPVLFLAQLDTVQSVSSAAKPVYPRLYALEAGVNFFDGILALAGQKYGGADAWVQLNMWNWLLPTLEVGFGRGKDSPHPGYYTARTHAAPFLRLGTDYNFLYKSNPRYKVMAGLRAGWSTYTYSVDGLWPATAEREEVTLGLNHVRNHAWWGEAVATLRVGIYRNLSMGWTFRYKFLFSTPKNRAFQPDPGEEPTPVMQAAQPWYVPGYGKIGQHLGVTLSLSYTFDFHRKENHSAAPGVD